MAVEGVLSHVSESRSVAAGLPIDEGFRLYYALSTQFRIVAITTSCDPGPIDAWLRREGFRDFVGVSAASPMADDPSPVAAARDHVLKHRSYGPVGLLVTADPEVAAESMHLGVPALLFCQPAYMRPEHRPDTDRRPRPWDAVAQEKTSQQTLKRRDHRLAET